jgi:hypothetical protein
MCKNKTDSLRILIAMCLFYLLSFPMNSWLSATMPRHQLIQMPAMLVIGMVLARTYPRLKIKDISWGIALLIFIMFSLIFWMLPHSIDYAVINIKFNRAMHVNMIICGLFLIAVLRSTLFEIRILFLEMLSAMLFATGITLRTFDTLLCSSFNISQQKQTGTYLILIGVILFAYTFITFFRMTLISSEGSNVE